jgi:hypothetical protein
MQFLCQNDKTFTYLSIWHFVCYCDKHNVLLHHILKSIHYERL